MKQKIITIIAIASFLMSVATMLQLFQLERDYAEINRLQGIFNNKTIEFFKMINENEQLKNQLETPWETSPMALRHHQL